jgi:hypothetical protein
MKALSIRQPWAWLIVNGLKDIENRDWTTNYRGFLLIHAGKKRDKQFPWGKFEQAERQMPQPGEYELGGIVGYVTLSAVVTSSKSHWFSGKYGFVLTKAATVPFITLSGRLGLFDVPTLIERQINTLVEQRERIHDSPPSGNWIR